MSRRVLLIAFAVLLAAPAPALAAGPHVPVVSASVLGTLGGLVGGVFSGIGHAVLGAFSWTIGLASKFILTTIAALVKLLIPHAWITKSLQIMEWIVAVPDYAGKITTPGGVHEYGFAGINALRDLFMWLGVAIAPLTLVYATSRAMIGETEPVGIPVLRVAAVAVVILSYPYWWSQAAALADQITRTILTLHAVSQGLDKLMQYAVGGVALGGWQLVDLALMGAIGIELLMLIFLKVTVILLGALLYATGPLMIGLVPTRAGGALARAWLSAVTALFALGIAWTTVFAVGALLIGDAGAAGPLIGGNSTFGGLVGGLLLAIAGLASVWLCLKTAREAGGLLRLQLSGLLALGHSHAGTSTTASTRARTTGQSLRDYGSRLGRAAAAAGGQLTTAIPGGAGFASAGRTAGYVGRRGLVGTAAAGARAGTGRASGPIDALLGRSRAGAIAVGMARAGTASWTASQRTSEVANGDMRRRGQAAADKTAASGNGQATYSPHSEIRNGGPQPIATRQPSRTQTMTGTDRSATPAVSLPDRLRHPAARPGTDQSHSAAGAGAMPRPKTPPPSVGSRHQSSAPASSSATRRSPAPRARPTSGGRPPAPSQPEPERSTAPAEGRKSKTQRLRRTRRSGKR